MIHTDRSRIAAYQRCPQLRLLRYHAGEAGKGYEPLRLAAPLADGSFVHAVAGAALLDPAGTTWRSALANETLTYMSHATGRGIEGVEDFQEATFRLAALTTLWVKRRLPQILEEFEVVEVEREHLWEMVPETHAAAGLNGVVDHVRCDALLRRKADRALFLQEFKTTKAFSPAWAAQWTYNSQILANLQAMEAITKERVEGVIIEGMLKAPYLAVAWRKLDGSLSLKGHKGWDQEPQWPRMSPEEWVSGAPWTDMERDALFSPQVALRPTTAQLSRWKEQTIWQERRIDSDLKAIASLDAEKQAHAALMYFPMFDDSCRSYGRDCEFLSICYKSEVKEDPIGSGLYQERVPHHPE